MARITIFHTSDLHNKLTPECAERLRDLKAEIPDSLLFDSGDALWAGNAFWRPGGEPILDLMNSIPYDAMCMGNREFHFLARGIVAKTSKAAFPVLSANLRVGNRLQVIGYRGEWTGDRFHKPANSYTIFNRGDLRIAVFGLSVPCITRRMLIAHIADYYFEQPIAAAAEIVPKLRAECDLLIALTHIGIDRDRELAREIDGIDIILGGHTHALSEEPERVGRTWIMHHGVHARWVGRMDVQVDSGEVSLVRELIPLSRT